MGEICCVAPAACDDVAVMSPGLDALQKLISTAVDYSRVSAPAGQKCDSSFSSALW